MTLMIFIKQTNNRFFKSWQLTTHLTLQHKKPKILSLLQTNYLTSSEPLLKINVINLSICQILWKSFPGFQLFV